MVTSVPDDIQSRIWLMNTIEDLIGIMARLRDPERGCPWDRVQTYRTIAPYTIEEAYEVADAVERENLPDLRDELGDLLFQVVFHAQLAREAGAFGFEEVVDAIAGKMIRRHPHVFGDGIDTSRAEQSQRWEEMKAAERAESGSGESLLDDIPVALPALTRAAKLQRRAARGGFDWPNADEVIEKIAEELGELKEAVEADNRDGIDDELGDLLFSVVNLARHVGADPERCARSANAKFERRFRELERRATADGACAETLTLAELDKLWTEIKAEEGGRGIVD